MAEDSAKDSVQETPAAPVPPRKVRPRIELGWAELVDVEALGLIGIRAKIDTGARTSALHATDIEPYSENGEARVRFRSETGPEAEHIWCSAPLVEQRCVTSSNGVEEIRYIIDVRIRLAGISVPVQLSLTDRTPMAFPMLVGRTALKRHFIVNVARKYQHGAPDN